MSTIFLSYRREDSEGYVGRLYDCLLQHFEERELFLDVKTIKPGEDFVRAIERMGGICDALVAVIGPKWLDIRDEKGYRRLDNPRDYVRYEIASALKRKILVIPVLVARARMPRENDLPNELSELSKRNAIELSHDRFAYDVERIAHAIGGSYGKILVKVGFKGSGVVTVYDNQKVIGKITLKKSQQPLAIQVENGAHLLHATYLSLLEISRQDIFSGKLKINESGSVIKSDVLPIHIKVGQNQSITIEREMIFPAQYETKKEPYLTNPNHYFEREELKSPPRYRLTIKPY